MAKAIYYNELLDGTVFEIFTENKDAAGKVESLDIGTVSKDAAGREVKTLVVGRVLITAEPKIGCVTLVSEAPAKAEDKSAKK